MGRRSVNLLPVAQRANALTNCVVGRCFCIRRNRRSLSRPRAGFACSRQRFRFGFRRTHRGRHGLRRSPGCRDDRRPADSFKEFYTGGRFGRDHGPDRVRSCLAWLSGAPDGEAVFGPHLHTDPPAYINSSWYCTPCCRIWLWARRGPSTICQACYHPAASPTASASSGHRRDPCCCHLAGPSGANPVRPRPRRAYGNSSLTAYISSWRHADCIYKVRCPRRRC